MNNPMQMIMSLLQSGKNPQAIITQMMKNNTNPVIANAFNLMQQGKNDEVEQIARNLCKTRGMDYEKEFNTFKSMIGRK